MSSAHTQVEGIIWGCGYPEVGIIGDHLGGCFHFLNEELEASRGSVTCPGCLTLKPRFLTMRLHYPWTTLTSFLKHWWELEKWMHTLCWEYKNGRGLGTEIESLLGFLLCHLTLCPEGYYYPLGPHFLHLQWRRPKWSSSVVGLLWELREAVCVKYAAPGRNSVQASFPSSQ